MDTHNETPRRPASEAVSEEQPFGFYGWASNGDGTESPVFGKRGSFDEQRITRDRVPLYAHPPRQCAAVSEPADQEFSWLLETNPADVALYWNGCSIGGQWTTNPYEAVRFPTREAAEHWRIQLRMWDPDQGWGYPDPRPVEHGFIYANPCGESSVPSAPSLCAEAVSEEPKCDPTQTECPRCKNDISKCDDVFRGNTRPVTAAQIVERCESPQDALRDMKETVRKIVSADNNALALTVLSDFMYRVRERQSRALSPAPQGSVVVPVEPTADEWLLQDTRSYVGNDVLFWKAGGGYTTSVAEAERFTKEKAWNQHYHRSTDLPWPVAYILGKTRPAVDFQYINHEEAMLSAAKSGSGE